MTMRDGGIGCICHNFSPNDSVNVWIEGPDTLQKNITAQFKLFMTGGPAVEGGFNIASYTGQLSPLDTLAKLISGELTHSLPNPFENDTVSWNFNYAAPDSILTDTLYSVGNSVNGDGNPNDLDKWNFGKNFIIHVVDSPVNVEEHNIHPEQFALFQNYPNPFNPITNIKYSIKESGLVQIKIYDILGNQIAVLVNEYKPAGTYEVMFNSHLNGSQNLSSGVYLYSIKAGDFAETKKMTFLK